MSKDELGTRMKLIEKREAGTKLMPLLPICVRLDGKGFSKFTKGFKRPYDQRMSEMMIATTLYLVRESGACMGYTQSDEISLVLYSDSYDSQVYFDGKIQKLVSILAAKATVYFNHCMETFFPEKKGEFPVFDCRVWNVPNKMEAVNVLQWREIDATKNSVSMAAQHYFSHNELMNKGRADMMDMLMEKGINWNDYPSFFKRGTFVQRKKTIRAFTKEEMEKLPEKHEARNNPDLKIERTGTFPLELPKFSSIKNRIEVVFDGADPMTYSEMINEITKKIEYK